jgi:hypothetical protein
MSLSAVEDKDLTCADIPRQIATSKGDFQITGETQRIIISWRKFAVF